MTNLFAILGSGASMVVVGLLVAIAVYLVEKYVTEEPGSKPGKLAYLVATVLVIVGILVFLAETFS
jgi:hypothetical protein